MTDEELEQCKRNHPSNWHRTNAILDQVDDAIAADHHPDNE